MRKRGTHYTHTARVNAEDSGLPIAADFQLEVRLDAQGERADAFPRILGLDGLPAPALRDQLIEHHREEIQALADQAVEELLERWEAESREAQAATRASHIPLDHNGDPIA